MDFTENKIHKHSLYTSISTPQQPGFGQAVVSDGAAVSVFLSPQHIATGEAWGEGTLSWGSGVLAWSGPPGQLLGQKETAPNCERPDTRRIR